MAYSLDEIFIESIFEVKDIYDVSFKVKPNMHTVLMIECSVKENQNIESIVRNLYEKNLTLFIYWWAKERLNVLKITVLYLISKAHKLQLFAIPTVEIISWCLKLFRKTLSYRGNCYIVWIWYILPYVPLLQLLLATLNE